MTVNATPIKYLIVVVIVGSLLAFMHAVPGCNKSAGTRTKQTKTPALPSEITDALTTDNADAFSEALSVAALSDDDARRTLLTAIEQNKVWAVTYMLDSAIIDLDSWPSSSVSPHVSPLAEAMRHEDLKIARILLVNGVGIETEPSEISPMLAAVLSGNMTGIRLLGSHGAAVDAVTPNGRTLLGYAVMRLGTSGDVEPLKTLLDLGADPNYETAGGETALFLAVRGRYKDAIRILIEHGADPYHIANYKGRAKPRTPIDIARDWRGEEAERLLTILDPNHNRRHE